MNLVRLGYDQNIIDIIREHGSDIIADKRFQEEKSFVQHSNISTYTHSLCVTYLSVWLALHSRKKDKYDMRTLVRGALLHDYFLYDWHDTTFIKDYHGFTHAGISVRNAVRDFNVTEEEKRVIYCHMFPLNITHIPTTLEARTVCYADKMCASSEVLSVLSYHPVLAGV